MKPPRWWRFVVVSHYPPYYKSWLWSTILTKHSNIQLKHENRPGHSTFSFSSFSIPTTAARWLDSRLSAKSKRNQSRTRNGSIWLVFRDLRDLKNWQNYDSNRKAIVVRFISVPEAFQMSFNFAIREQCSTAKPASGQIKLIVMALGDSLKRQLQQHLLHQHLKRVVKH